MRKLSDVKTYVTIKPFLDDGNVRIETLRDEKNKITGFKLFIRKQKIEKQFDVKNNQIKDCYNQLEKFFAATYK